MVFFRPTNYNSSLSFSTLLFVRMISMSTKSESVLDGLVDRYINRRFSPPLTELFILLRFHPNSVTLLSLFVGLIACFFFYKGGYWNGVIGAFMFQSSALLDCCDGEVARRTGKITRFGRWLDLLGDNVIHLLLFLSLAVSRPLLGPLLGWSVAIGVPLSVGALLLAIRTGGMAKTAALRLGNRDFSLLLIILALFGKLDLFLLLAAIGIHLFWLILLILIVNEKIRPFS